MAAVKEAPALPTEVLEAAQRIWFAGLGVLSMAQEEGGRVFAALVEQGKKIERSGLSATVALKTATDAADDVKRSAEETWKRLQALFDAQIASALHRLGIPTRDEIEALARKIDRLTAAVDALKTRR